MMLCFQPKATSRDSRLLFISQLNQRESGRRIVDFFSGLAFGTDGTFEKVAEGLYLLTPPVD